MGKRLAAAEAGAAAASEALTGVRRLAARLADSDARASQQAGRVAGIAGTLPVLAGQVAAVEQRVTTKLTVSRRALDNLADQLIALGNMARPEKKNPLAGE